MHLNKSTNDFKFVTSLAKVIYWIITSNINQQKTDGSYKCTNIFQKLYLTYTIHLSFASCKSANKFIADIVKRPKTMIEFLTYRVNCKKTRAKKKLQILI